uniref:Granzyme M n=1 Tax=Oryzias melastigma TaxID=30732 RepID=A0A3B3BNT6_ORYME
IIMSSVFILQGLSESLNLELLSLWFCFLIVNGEKVPEGALPYLVSVQNITGHVCGGFLISTDFVMTAAHCDKLNPTNVVVGSHNLNKIHKKMRIKFKKCKHGHFQQTITGYDIMLLQLNKRVNFNDRVKPIRLPKRGMTVKEKSECTVAGWGKTRTGGEQVKELQMVNVSVISLDQCQRVWKKYDGILPDGVVCAGGYATDKGFCQGDSGGPLVCGGTAVGIVSFNRGYICDYPNVPNVYTDLSKYTNWIQKKLKEKKCFI